jgi:pSer/pThr/pTyr-binding forkhead associated (FHA) protein
VVPGTTAERSSTENNRASKIAGFTVINKHSIDLFMEGCGATGQLRVSVHCVGKPDGGDKNLYLPVALVGRDANTDFPLSDPHVSRRHAYFQMIEGRLFCIDLASRTGVFWDQERRSSGWVNRNQVLRIGPFSLRFSGWGPDGPSIIENDWDPLATASPEDDRGPELVLEFLKGPNRPAPWRMTSTLAVVGRAETCNLVLPDMTVWAQHFSLLRTPLGTWAIDLLGQAGITLNDRRVRWGRLEEGDRLRVGKYLIRIHGQAPDLPARSEAFAEFRAMVEQARVKLSADRPNGGPAHAPPVTAEASERKREETIPEEESVPIGRSASSGSSLVAVAPVMAPSASTELAVKSLFDSFTAMQNQMFDQFHESMVMMVEMFGDMQRDQMGMIRQEVDRLHEISDELKELQEELGKHPAPSPVQAAAVKPRTEDVPAPPDIQVTENLPAKSVKASTVAKNAPKGSEAEGPRVAPPGEGTAAPPKPVTVGESATATPAPKVKQSKIKLPEQPEVAEDDSQAWLYDQIAALQRERQTRLKRLFDFLRGK